MLLNTYVSLKSDKGKLMPLRLGKVTAQEGTVCTVESYIGGFPAGKYDISELKVSHTAVE